MAEAPQRIRTARASNAGSFDDQLWPINVAVLILAGFVAGVVIAVSDFDDPRILFNGWARLGGVAAMVALCFWGVRLLQGRMRRRLQLCIVFSLLVHLALSIYLHEQFIALLAAREADAQSRMVEEVETITVPGYQWEEVDRPEVRQVFDEPIEHEAPRPGEPEAIRREAEEPELPTKQQSTEEPEALQPQLPNPAELKRIELSSPRRHADAGVRISRQPWMHRPMSNEPIPEPLIKPQPQQEAAAVPDVAITPRRHEPIRVKVDQRQVFEEPSSTQRLLEVRVARRASRPERIPDVPTTPAPTRQTRRPAEIPRTEAAAPEPVRIARPAQQVQPKPAPIYVRRHAATPQSVRQTSVAASIPPSRAVAVTGARQRTAEQAPRSAPTPWPIPARPLREMSLARTIQGAGPVSSAVAAEAAPAVQPAAVVRTNFDAPQRRTAGLQGDLMDRTEIDMAAEVGAATTTPGMVTGKRRVPQGDQPGPSLAAEVGRGPPGRIDSPGLYSGIAQLVAEAPVASVAAAASGSAPRAVEGLAASDPGRQAGGLPVQIVAVTGPGGLAYDLSPEVGLASRRARPTSEIVHTVPRRFITKRTSGEFAIDGRVREQPAKAFRQRDVGRRAQIAQKYGGTETTEKAIEQGLDFFARHQFPDGRWSLHALPPGLKYDDPALGQTQSDSVATGLALLAYLGAGYTHLDDKHRTVVHRGIDWLVRNQEDNGDLFSKTGRSQYAWLYSHGIATIALCEAYGMTRDPELREPARKAVDFILGAQDPTRGGWRYQPGRGTDTSVSGWQLMALKSAQMASLAVPAGAFAKIDGWLSRAAAPRQKGRYAYNPYAADTVEQRSDRQPNLAMTAEAMLMRMYLGHPSSNANLLAGADYLKANLPAMGTAARPARDCYYWYYATQAMFQLQRDYWPDWNDRLRDIAESSQVSVGEAAGSWHPHKPVRDRWGHAGGRIYVTAMHLLMLEVYYRHLPLFQELVGGGP